MIRRNLLLASLFVCGSLLSANMAHAERPVQAEGVIADVFFNTAGAVAVRLDGEIPESAKDMCPHRNGYLGIDSDGATAEIKSAILAAKLAGTRVVLDLSGCASGGAWIQVTSIYLK